MRQNSCRQLGASAIRPCKDSPHRRARRKSKLFDVADASSARDGAELLAYLLPSPLSSPSDPLFSPGRRGTRRSPQAPAFPDLVLSPGFPRERDPPTVQVGPPCLRARQAVSHSCNRVQPQGKPKATAGHSVLCVPQRSVELSLRLAQALGVMCRSSRRRASRQSPRLRCTSWGSPRPHSPHSRSSPRAPSGAGR